MGMAEHIEYRILKALESHKGKDNPITAKALSKKAKAPEREVRRVISYLVTNHRLLIASSVHSPYGFYLIEDVDELKRCLSQYCSRLKNLRDRAQSLYKSGLKKFSKEIQHEFSFNHAGEANI